MEFDQVLQNRHSVRKFKGSEIDEDKVERIMRAVVSAPSAGNLQAYEVAVVVDKDRKASLAEAALGQGFIAQAPVVLVFFANRSVSAGKYGERGDELYAVQDATIAATFAWLKAVDEDLAACWVGAFDPARVQRIFRVDSDLEPVVMLPIGVAEGEPGKTSRKDLEEILMDS